MVLPSAPLRAPREKLRASSLPGPHQMASPWGSLAEQGKSLLSEQYASVPGFRDLFALHLLPLQCSCGMEGVLVGVLVGGSHWLVVGLAAGCMCVWGLCTAVYVLLCPGGEPCSSACLPPLFPLYPLLRNP